MELVVNFLKRNCLIQKITTANLHVFCYFFVFNNVHRFELLLPMNDVCNNKNTWHVASDDTFDVDVLIQV